MQRLVWVLSVCLYFTNQLIGHQACKPKCISGRKWRPLDLPLFHIRVRKEHCEKQFYI